ncbi:hypothetical protein [Chitinophaga rhizophila]|uniref:Uncharacterized protein n=1 Tax=Chitinophaga rhizophila TaxID=2866212 RepID=A0ABS7GLK9_9BACT|nr:hypothetical protein [Chitinophaga rhizophila]MBW8688140.1 hypothetical protein [Chitinophaga rhizophila]
MSTVACFDEKVQETVSSIEHTEKSVIQASDEHANRLIDVAAQLQVTIGMLKQLVDNIESSFNSYSEAQAGNMVTQIFPIFRLSASLKEALHKENLIESLSNLVEDFDAEVKDLLEITNDLSRYKVNVRNDFDALFNH